MSTIFFLFKIKDKKWSPERVYLGGYPKASSKILCAFLGIISSNEEKKRITFILSLLKDGKNLKDQI